jgi:hypothetical protein
MSTRTLNFPQPVRSVVRRYALALSVVIVLITAFALAIRPGVQAAPDAGPDLTVEIILEPTVPDDGGEVNIKFVVYNKGTSTTGTGFTAYLYVDPADRPPTLATLGRPFGFPALAAGGSAPAERPQTISGKGCDHVIYVWIDRDNQIAESDENNNLIALPFCVGVQCEIDDFEDDDNSDKAGWITTGTTQERSFCRSTNTGLTPAGDQDWVKFTAFAGLTYTLATDNTGLHADPRIRLYWGGPTQTVAGPTSQIVWQPPANGVYYAQIRNSEDKEDSGPLTQFDLSLNAVPAVTDDFEPDDLCGQARDIPTDGTHQTRLFQAPGDADWIKFTIAAGETFALVADQVAQGVSPSITLFSSCVQSRSNERVAEGTNRVEGRSTGDQIYYARITNQNPDRFGADAKYRISVLAANCIPDAFEENDTLNQAANKPLALDQPQTHSICPAGDQDWARLDLTAGQIYVIKTNNLGFAADTVLELYDAQGNQIAVNDDYDYVKASRLFFQPTTSGAYYAMVRHHDPVAAGANTNYDLSVEIGFCIPDEADDAEADNGPGDARAVLTGGDPVTRNFCVNPATRTLADQSSLGDQDWMRFSAISGGRYHIRTEDLGPNADTVISLYDRDGSTLIARNDDSGLGLSTEVVFTPTVSGDYFVQVTQYNSRLVGRETSYNLSIEENLPPPTPTPIPPTPTPTPTATPTPDPSDVRTLIVANRAGMESIHGAGPTGLIMAKLFELADHAGVDGAVLQVDQDPAVAAAYAAWLANASAQADNDLANATAGAIRNSILSFSAAAPDLTYLVIVGDDRLIPFRRVAEAKLSKNEREYAAQLTVTNTIAAALAEDMILTDDFYGDLEPSQWKGNELYVPDFAVGRLVQEPNEIISQIDTFLGGGLIETESALVTGYDFVQDSASLIRGLMVNDTGFTVSPADYISNNWPANVLRATLLTGTPAGSRFDMISINGHATHISFGAPIGGDILASEIMTATNDFVRTLVYNIGCHSGLNDSAVLDLPQAFVGRGAVYVGNTGFGWGGGGIVYSEALMRNFTREILTDRKATVGVSLSNAKQSYVSRARAFGGYDAKILMQTTLYGLPMFEITSGGTLSNEDPFTGIVAPSIAPPGSFSDEPNRGSFGYGLPGSFGAFSSDEDDPGYKLSLKNTDSIVFEAGAPIQPSYYRDLSAPNAGSLRGVLFRGGVYSDTVAAAPIALAYNEYITETTPPEFDATGWYPPVPFGLQSSAFDAAVSDTVVLSLGQYDSNSGAQRVFDRMSFDTYYSDSPDRSLAEIRHVDAVLDPAAGKGIFKVETTDASGVSRVLIAYTEGAGTWTSQDLLYDQTAAKWTGLITATANTRYFVQVVDGAGNIAVDDNKGQYHPLLPPLPLAQGRALDNRLYLPSIKKGN